MTYHSPSEGRVQRGHHAHKPKPWNLPLISSCFISRHRFSSLTHLMERSRQSGEDEEQAGHRKLFWVSFSRDTENKHSQWGWGWRMHPHTWGAGGAVALELLGAVGEVGHKIYPRCN